MAANKLFTDEEFEQYSNGTWDPYSDQQDNMQTNTVPINNNAPDFVPGVQRELQNLQASFYGAGALAGSGLKKLGAETAGQKLQDIGREGYHRNIEEAAQYPQKHSFRDVYTGKAGFGGTIDYVQAKAGGLVPSMVEALIGSAVGTAIAGPGAGTAVGGLAGRTILKKGIDQIVKKAMKEGIKGISEKELRKQVTKQAIKKLGGKVGLGAAVMPMESGSTYADLLEEHNVDAPGIALFAGALKTSLEFFGGNSKLVDIFVDSLAKGSKGIVKRSAKAILSNIPQEALQEGGQELIDILTTVANTDEKLLTVENLESIAESMFVGSIGGGVGAATTTMMGGKETIDEKKNRQIDQYVQNVISGGEENIQAANEKLTNDLTDINTLLKDPDALEATAVKRDISVEDLTVDLNTKVTELTERQNRLQKETGLDVDAQIDKETVDDQINKETVDKTQKETVTPPSEEDLYFDRQTEIIKKQQLDRLWYDYERNDITLDQVKNRLKNYFKFTADEITAQISERKNTEKERQRRKEQQVEIDRLWTEYNNPDRSAEARKDIQKDLDALYWPAEQEADEMHNRKIRQLLELAKTSEEKDIAHTAIRNFYARSQQVKTPIDETTGEPTLIDSPQRTIVGEQEPNFLDRATERLGGKVEPSIIYDKEKYAREVRDEETNRTRTPEDVRRFEQRSGKLFNDSDIPILEAGKAAGPTILEGPAPREGLILPPGFQRAAHPQDFLDQATRILGGKVFPRPQDINIESDTNEISKAELSQMAEISAQKISQQVDAFESEEQAREALHKKQIEKKEFDAFQERHLARVAEQSKQIAKELGLDEDPGPVPDVRRGSFTGGSKETKTRSFTNEQQVDGDPQFEVRETNFVKDSSGQELIGYHGTSAQPFKAFDDSKRQEFEHGWAGAGHYFTLDPEYAQNYAETNQLETGKSDRIVKARFSFKNPLYKYSSEYNQILEDTLGTTSILNKKDGFKATKAFKAAGYDAVIEGTLDNAFEINVFEAKNIHYAPEQYQFEVREAVHYGSYKGGKILSHMLHSGEGSSILGPGIYFSTDLDLGKNVYNEYGNETKISAELDTFYDPIHGPALPGIQAALKEAGLDTPEKVNRADNRKLNLKHGRGYIGALVYTVGPEKARQLLVKHGIQGAKEKLPDGSYEIAVFDDSILPQLNKEKINKKDFYTKDEILLLNELDSLGNNDWLAALDAPKYKAILEKIDRFGKPTEQNSTSEAKKVYLEVRENQAPGQGIQLAEIQKMYPEQDVFIGENNEISIRFKNGQGITIDNIQDAGKDFIEFAIQTGQMSKEGRILGVTLGNKILIDKDFADKKTPWHENKHALDNLGMITTADNNALNREFNKLHKAGKLEFPLSTAKNPKTGKADHVQRMKENRANMFAQIMVNREAYRNHSTLNKIIQKVMDFFNQIYTLGRKVVNKDFQSVGSLARETESGKLYERETNDINDPHIIPQLQIDEKDSDKITTPMFETREPLPEQKISDQRYGQIVNQKKNLLTKYGQSLRMKSSAIKLMIERSLTPISTRLKIIGLDDLSGTLRQLDFRTAMNITAALKVAHPMMKRMKRKDVSKDDRTIWDWARKNSDLGKITQIARKYGFEEDYNKLREVLNKIRQDAIDVGLTVGYIEDYWPRVLKDQEGFLQATQGISRRADFTEAIKRKADSLGLSVAQMDDKYPDLKADIISNLILGRPEGMGGPSNTQARKFPEIPPEYAEFYDDSDSALMGYIYSMTKKIEARRFFGKVPQRIATIKRKRNSDQTELLKLEQLAALGASEAMTEDQQELVSSQQERIKLLKNNVKDYEGKLEDYKQANRDYTENIGVYVNDLMLTGKLHKKDEKAVKDILAARFHERGTTGPVHWYKNLAYIDVLGNPMAAMTQIGDIAWAMYVGEVWNPLRLPSNIKNLTRALFKRSNITKEDLGIERMAQEFADFDSLSRAVSGVFKWVGLERIDSIGKEFLINNAFDAYKRQASTEEGRAKLLKKIRPTFGNQSNKVINELLALDKNSTADPSENIKMLLYSRLLDFQPVALSEMPEYYLKGGNWRILYMLKTFTLKQLDVFRNEVWRDLRHGDAQQKLKAIGNMTALMGVLALANAGADEVKDFMVGKETKFSDAVIENFLTMGGANRHVRMQARREGIGTAVGQMVLPPFKFVNSMFKDTLDLSMFDLEKSRTLESVPFIGKLAYWRVGRGKEYRPSIEEQDFRKAGKKFRKFKKDFEEANDKRLFLQANIEEFKQLKVYENFQKSIRKITARINKLKKLAQNTNVLTLIGQLELTQEQLRQRYFGLSELTN